MKTVLLVCAVLTVAGCADGTGCAGRLVPINSPAMLRRLDAPRTGQPAPPRSPSTPRP
ncbi:MAG: hypothetical protein ACP5PN_07440 [Steroidobacteraceae bacterium]